MGEVFRRASSRGDGADLRHELVDVVRASIELLLNYRGDDAKPVDARLHSEAILLESNVKFFGDSIGVRRAEEDVAHDLESLRRDIDERLCQLEALFEHVLLVAIGNAPGP